MSIHALCLSHFCSHARISTHYGLSFFVYVSHTGLQALSQVRHTTDCKLVHLSPDSPAMETLSLASLASYELWALQKLAAEPGLTYARLRRLLQEEHGQCSGLSYALYILFTCTHTVILVCEHLCAYVSLLTRIQYTRLKHVS